MKNTLAESEFIEVFEQVSSQKTYKDYLNALQIKGVNYLKKKGIIEIQAVSQVLIPSPAVIAMEESFKKLFGTDSLRLKIRFDTGLSLDRFLEEYWDSLIYCVNREFISAKAVLYNCDWTCDKDTLVINIRNKGAHILKAARCDTLISERVNEWTGCKLSVKFIDVEFDTSLKEKYLEFKREEEKEIIQNGHSAKIVKYPSGSAKGEPEGNTVKKPGDVVSIIKGKKINEAPVDINSLNAESGTVCICGDIFSEIESREIRKKRYIVSFDVTDYKGSISVKFFLKGTEVTDIVPALKKGMRVKIRGDVQYDAFERDIVILARDIAEVCREERMDNAPYKRVELHLHTQMSAMDAVTPAGTLVATAAKWGHKAVAITDHGVVQAFPEAKEAADKYGIKVIYGMECYLVDDTEGEIDITRARPYHAIILVKNQTGMKNLYKIVSKSHLDYLHKTPKVPRKLLMAYREGLILVSACEAGELYRAILEKKSENEIRNIAEFYDFLEIQPLGNNMFLLDSGQVNSVDELININKKIVELGDSLGKPVVATCDVHFLNPWDEVFRRILMAGQGYDDADRQPPLYFRTTEEMLAEFEYLGREKAFEVVVKNTNLVADLVEEVKPIPDGTFPPKIDGAEEQIKLMAEQRAKEIYGDPLPEIVKVRLDKELNSIIKNGFSVMYLIAQKLVSKSVSDGYLVGSRGSVGSSFVAYTLGITEVNSLPAHYVCENEACKYSEFVTDGRIDCGFDLPDKVCPSCGRKLKKDGYDIPFETFLGFDGDKEPDIDLNFSGEYQANAHKYVEELFGEGHVFRAGTIATIASKTAFGFVKNYLDERSIKTTNAEIRRLVEGCSGIKRTTGQHPGGVMIVPHGHDIYEFCPIQRPADDTTSDVITTHFDYHSISGKLLKLDILGHDDPTVIRMLEDITGVDARKIPIGEKRTMSIFSSTDALGIKPEDINCPVGTFGIPEFGTKFVRQMLIDTKPKTFSELIRISGLSHGTDVWLNNAQDLIRSGTATLPEVISTRDDIMLYLIHAGLEPITAFKIMEDVRKGKGLKAEYEDIMQANKIPSWYIESCKKIKYMFPKAHAAAYVMMAFRIAWFKVYYPEAFYAAYFTVRADDFDAEIMTRGRELIKVKIDELEARQKENTISQKEKNVLTILEVANEMYARGINFLPIDLYESDATRFLVTPEGIRPPFNALQGLGIAASQSIASARREGKFLSIDDLQVRSKVSKAVIEILDKAGCLKGLPQSNQISLFG